MAVGCRECASTLGYQKGNSEWLQGENPHKSRSTVSFQPWLTVKLDCHYWQFCNELLLQEIMLRLDEARALLSWQLTLMGAFIRTNEGPAEGEPGGSQEFLKRKRKWKVCFFCGNSQVINDPSFQWLTLPNSLPRVKLFVFSPLKQYFRFFQKKIETSK